MTTGWLLQGMVPGLSTGLRLESLSGAAAGSAASTAAGAATPSFALPVNVVSCA